jgi:DNA topoisomerase-6 subunit B
MVSKKTLAKKPPHTPAPSKTTKGAPPKARPSKATKATKATSTTTQKKAASAKTAPTKTASAKTAPTKTASAKTAPTKTAPTKTAPTKTAPTKTAPTKTAPTKTAPTKTAPIEARAVVRSSDELDTPRTTSTLRATTTGASTESALPTLKKTPRAARTAHADDELTAGEPDRKMPRQREIAVSEFFSKNRHLLGFDSPQKALLTAIREAVDNALDACEEARILPDVVVELEELEAPAPGQSSTRYRVRIEDNGPGIPKPELGKIFAKLLYGSKFHRLKQSRGQQGIGISAAVMYGQMTTGEPATVVSKLKGGRAHKVRLFIDTAKNAPRIDAESIDDSDAWRHKTSGTSIEILLVGQYKGGRHGVEAYLKQTGLANPHARVQFHFRKAATKTQPAASETLDMARVVKELPREPVEIKPHPHGVELGTLQRMLEAAGKQSIATFLASSFSRVPTALAHDVVTHAGLDPARASNSLSRPEAEQVYKALQAQKLMAPPTSCLSPIGEAALIKGLYALFGDASALQDDDDLEHLTPEKPQGPKALLSAEALEQAAAGALSAAADAAAQAEREPSKSQGKRSGKTTQTRAQAHHTKEQGDRFAPSTPPAEAPPSTLPSAASPLPMAATSAEKVKIEKDETGADVLVLGENVFVTAVTRPPAIYRGNPFQVECGILYSKDLRSDELAKVFRFANRVPLLYQASACAMTKAVISAPWRSYEVQQSKGALPTGPLVILVHIASAWVPYTSESKEAIAHYPEVLKEMRLAIMEAGRRLQRFLRRRRREVDEQKKRDYITKYLDTIGEALQEILGLSSAERARTTENLQVVLEKSRSQAVSDEERKRKRKDGHEGARP